MAKRSHPYTYQAFFNQCRYCSNINSKQQRFYIDKIHECRNNTKEIFYFPNNLLSSNNQLSLPPTEDQVSLANEFSDFFTTRIKRIMNAVAPDDPLQINTRYLEKEYKTTDHFIDFTATTEEDILKLIKAAPPKSCELDPLPMIILKAQADIFAPKISDSEQIPSNWRLHKQSQRGHIMTIIEENRTRITTEKLQTSV